MGLSGTRQACAAFDGLVKHGTGGYCAAVEQTERWATSVAKAVGRRVAHHRARTLDAQGRKLTTQGLADRTAELGHPMDRSVIAKLEKGHRHTITVPDVLVLAQALEVPPVLLIFPVGQERSVETLPDKTLSTWEAAKWFIGEEPWPGAGSPEETGDRWKEWQQAAAPLDLYRSHEQSQRRWARAKMNAFRDRKEADEASSEEGRAARLAAADEADRLMQTLEDTLRHVRQRMRDLGIELPVLLDNLRHLDTGDNRP